MHSLGRLASLDHLEGLDDDLLPVLKMFERI